MSDDYEYGHTQEEDDERKVHDFKAPVTNSFLHKEYNPDMAEGLKVRFKMY